MHAASLNRAEGASVPDTAAARDGLADTTETEAVGADAKIKPWEQATATSAALSTVKEQTQQKAAGALAFAAPSKLAPEPERRYELSEPVARAQQDRWVKILVSQDCASAIPLFP